MRVTFILGNPDATGGDRVIGRYARELSLRGTDVRLVALSEPRNLTFYEGLDLVSLGRPPFPRSRLDYLASCGHLASAVGDPGIVVATWTPTLPAAACLNAVRRGLGVLWMQQDYPLMFDGLRWERWLLENGLRFARRAMAVSEACAGYVAPRGDARVTVIHSGLEDVFYRERRPEPGGVLFVGAPIERKGWAPFWGAVSRVRAHREVPVTVVSQVPVPDDPRHGDLRVVGGLSDVELAAEYAGAAVYVCASLSEGWGLPALEAMAAGCPVVTTSHGGCEAYAQDGVNCLLVEPGDGAALAEAVRRVLDDDGLAARLVAGGRETAARYSWPRAVDRFEDVLREMADGA